MIRLAILSELLGGHAPDDPYVEPIVRVSPQLAQRGVELVRHDPDLVLVDSDRVESVDLRCPLILFDKTDGGMLWWYGAVHGDRARRWLQSPQVLGMLKLTRYKRMDAYNEPSAEGAVHLQKIYTAARTDLAATPLQPSIRLDERAFDKIAPGYGFWAFHNCADLANADLDLKAGRDLDVFCACTLDYASPAVTYHRRQAMQALERLAGIKKVIVKGRLLSHADYSAHLRSARVCVAPWGWGETTIRDYEAMLAGCVLIKPRTDFIDSIPAIDERHYVPCAVNFSDLPDKIDRVLNRWDDYAPMRRQNRELLTALCRSEAIADIVAAALRGFIAAID